MSASTSKYLIYAIDEIALVVIGILIALQINNWNEGRKAIRQGEQYIREVFRDLQIDFQNITMIMNTLQEQYESAVVILKVLESSGRVSVDSTKIFRTIINLPVAVNVERKQNTWITSNLQVD